MSTPCWNEAAKLLLLKATGAPAALSLTPNSGWNGGNKWFLGTAQGLVYPSVNDIVRPGVVTLYQGAWTNTPPTPVTYYSYIGLDDAAVQGPTSGTPYYVALQIDYGAAGPTVVFTGSGLNDFTAPDTMSGTGLQLESAIDFGTVSGQIVWNIVIDSTGTTDTFKWRANGGAWTTGVSTAAPTLTAPAPAIHFGAHTGHTLSDAWTVTIQFGDPLALPPRPDTFRWSIMTVAAPTVVLSSARSVPIVADPASPQPLDYGFSVVFGAQYGHRIGDAWIAVNWANNVIQRDGVAARGAVASAIACVNGGFPNNNVILTVELAAEYPQIGGAANNIGPYAQGSHALVVRDATTLALLYRKALDHDAVPYAWGDPPEKFSLSANAEGFFFLQCYTTPVLASPPTPYPGHEFGAPNPRKIAVISVNPLTFEPTIEEVVTLEDNAFTGGSSFVTAMSLP